jgi:DNA primase
LGQDLDLRELQRTGRIGRIDVDTISEEGKTKGTVLVPSSLDISETSLVAAALETIDRIGPCSSEIKIKNVSDVRAMKREFMIDRAKEILQNLVGEEIPPSSTITEKIKESVRTTQIQEYYGLPAGPDVLNSDEIIVVEGRADVINLLKNGVRNVIAVEGAVIPKEIVELSRKKITTLFVDGDRGGDLIVKEAIQLCDIDYITRAPMGKEVEELSKKEIFKLLRDRISAEQYKIEPKSKELKEFFDQTKEASDKTEYTGP